MTRLLGLVLVALVLAPAAALAAPWRRPVDGAVLRRFAVGADRFAAGQHRGVDLAAPRGTPVRSACTGRVRFAGTVGDAGRTVSVTCGELIASYLHLDAIRVPRGMLLRAGEVLGTVGRSGRPRGGPHLHLGARRVADGRYVDPLALLGDTPGAPPGGVPAPRRHPPVLGRAPRPGLEPEPTRRPATVVRPAPAPAAARVARSAPPWAALAGLVLLVGAVAPTAAMQRRSRRAREVHGAAVARR